MSLLPNAANATLNDQKITQYLLDSSHPVGAGKAKFFMARGFTQANWVDLKRALLDHPLSRPSPPPLTQLGAASRAFEVKVISLANGRALWLVRPQSNKTSRRMIWFFPAKPHPIRNPLPPEYVNQHVSDPDITSRRGGAVTATPAMVSGLRMELAPGAAC